MKKVLISTILMVVFLLLLTFTTQTLMAKPGSGPESETTTSGLSPEDTFPTSLHAQGPSNGRENIWDNGPGLLTKIPFRDTGCQNCHAETYADGTPVDDATYKPGCRDCHATPGDQVPQERCSGCHSMDLDQYSVHREAELECMDCHTLMFKLAGEMMSEGNFDFLFSGEVLGQRPMSQNKQSLHYVAKHSGHKGYILRPLSAKNLPETIPEKDGLVDREQLLDIAGRGRKRQIELAREFGVTEYPAPAGGCLLTDKNFSIRF